MATVCTRYLYKRHRAVQGPQGQDFILPHDTDEPIYINKAVLVRRDQLLQQLLENWNKYKITDNLLQPGTPCEISPRGVHMV